MSVESLYKYDLFISHASEDKDTFVRPLAQQLERLSVKVWYDEFSLQLGDSLSASIDKGLKESRYGLVVLSKAFFQKNWTEYEYRSLLVRQNDKERVILPLWYGVIKEDVKNYSLYLADIKGLEVTNDGYRKVIAAIISKVRPDIWKELRMRSLLRKTVEKSKHIVLKLSDIQSAESKQSKLTSKQFIRSKAVYYGIGKHLHKSFQEYIDDYELDVVPERELQSWEIMNACYLEMLERHPEASDSDKDDYFKIILSISIGWEVSANINQTPDIIKELIMLWKENYYDF